ncbi:hypothetical protein [Thermococcus sp.]|uniref:hypothetical protein n=1 Tax=Thermococcus sp. TaxID=35749 RepID=UPI0026197FF3|nr:hypothetical protein [Thermococcus sp.]
MRRGQLLSLDALISLIVMMFVFAAVVNTSTALKDEIASTLGWYERANIADNMLDVLMKSPGEPVDWELNPSSAKVVGLRDPSSIYSMSYEKIVALGENPAGVVRALLNESGGKDFLLSIYLSRFRVSISGRFPKVYLQNETFANPNGNGINFEITSGNGNNPFTVTWVQLERNGNVYTNDEMCTLISGNAITLQDGDLLQFVLAEDVTLTAELGQYVETYSIPSGARVVIRITGPDASNFQVNYGGGSCPYTFKFTGQGNVVVTVSAYDNTTPVFNSTYIFPTVLLQNNSPTYRFAVVNGSVVTDWGVINASMGRSPWIEPEMRMGVISRLAYNLSSGPSSEEPMIYGVLSGSLPPGAYMNVTVPSTAGNMTMFVLSGSSEGGLLIYRDDSGALWGITVLGGEIRRYQGRGDSIVVPLKNVFGSPQSGDTIGIWLYSLSGWRRKDVDIQLFPSLEWFLKPKFEQVLIQLKVWDDS